MTTAPSAPFLFGRAHGQDVRAIDLHSSSGMRARVLTLGATLQALTARDRDGRWDDIILGYDTAEAYLASSSYMGACIGRFANRIANGAFDLNSRKITLSRNEGAHTLHGGPFGLSHALWRIEAHAPDSVRLALTSPDGDQGFPGELEVSATYALRSDEDALDIILEARTDAPTVVSLTSHGYFNLGGDVRDHRLTLNAGEFTPIAPSLIPTGEIRAVSGDFDFLRPRRIGDGLDAPNDAQLRIAGGYDHNFVLRGGRTASPRLAARLEAPHSGRVLEVLTTEPGLQFYSGGSLNAASEPPGKGGRVHHRNAGICLEPQAFPDAPNQPHFPSAQLEPGQTYRHHIVLRLSASAAPMAAHDKA